MCASYARGYGTRTRGYTRTQGVEIKIRITFELVEVPKPKSTAVRTYEIPGTWYTAGDSALCDDTITIQCTSNTRACTRVYLVAGYSALVSVVD